MRVCVYVCVQVLVLHCAHLFSNSFIVAGRAVAHFLFSSLLLFWAVCAVLAGPPGRMRDMRAVGVVMMMVASRVALEHVARSHEKGVQEASTTSANAAAGLVLLIVAQEAGRSGCDKRGAVMRGARLVSCVCVAVLWFLQLSQRLEHVSAWVRLGIPRLGGHSEKLASYKTYPEI